jgi:CheY-like chemotaxis protein
MDTVLVVDDDKAVTALVREELKAGFDVAVAETAPKPGALASGPSRRSSWTS